jgi:IclR family pca regulon transcriptional regulator
VVGEWLPPVLCRQDARYSQSLERGLAILGCFTPGRPLLRVSELAEELGMSRSTTHRYVLTLVRLGYMEQGESRKYRLALGVTDLGLSALSSTGLREHARAIMRELRDRMGYAVSLALLDGTEVLYVERVSSVQSGQSKVDVGLTAGSRLPAYCTAMGKLLLAYLPGREQRNAISELTLARCAPRTITTKTALRAELRRARGEGFAVNDEECSEGTVAVALKQLVGLLAHLLATADRVSARLGYRGASEGSLR